MKPLYACAIESPGAQSFISDPALGTSQPLDVGIEDTCELQEVSGQADYAAAGEKRPTIEAEAQDEDVAPVAEG